MKRSGFLPRRTPLRTKTRIRVAGHSDTATTKQNIQYLLWQIVQIRDGGCLLRHIPGHQCNGYAKDGHLVLQADHLVTRANSATYGDSRLVVCVCKGAHGWKSLGSNRNKAQYDALVKTLLPPERVKLWEACEVDSWRATRSYGSDWKAIEVALGAELVGLSSEIPRSLAVSLPL